MASIFKRGCDKKNRRAGYWIEYKDHDGKRRRKKGFTDYELTCQLAGKLENDAMLRRTGLVDPVQEKLAEQRRLPIDVHLTGFETNLKQRGRTKKYVGLTMSRVRAVIYGCDVATLEGLEAETVQTYLFELRHKDDLGAKTYNHYVQALDSFCRWMVQAGRIAVNPLSNLSRLNTDVDIRHQRRALTPDEMSQLVNAARSSDQRIQGYDGELRARLYLMSYLTGLRRSELASLTPVSFQVTAEHPTLTVEAAFSKHRRKDILPLHPELTLLVREWIVGMQPTEKLFPKLDRKKTWFMVKKDLERAGIEYETAESIADFHAAGRHSHITQLLRSGASLAEARQLARHGDVRMTMRYTHIGLNDQARALASLPSPKHNPTEPNSQAGSASSQQTSQHSSGRDRQMGSKRDTTWQDAKKNPEASSAVRDGTYDASGQSVAESGTDSAQWRRRESNPCVRLLQRSLR